ncbi:MAG TPA: phenylalanine--tRNA ligase subunit beta, partial [Anaeromyxobacteraceae bacterium]|nr:phenylalanine--tRNA ligase subunit beta [Anaeromyxobacteraceae bacterium]
PRHSATLVAIAPGGGEDVVGVAGELHPRTAAAFDLPRGVLAFTLSMDALLSRAALVPQYHSIPRFPAVLRDLAVVLEERIQVADALAAIHEEPLVEEAAVFDVYRGKPLPEGKKNVAVAIRYRAPDRTLTDAEADAAHARIVKRLGEKLGAELRG